MNELEITWRILLYLCHPIADLLKSPGGGNDSDRITDTRCVIESCTQNMYSVSVVMLEIPRPGKPG